MTPTTPDRKQELLEAAFRKLEEGGADSLRGRELTREIGVSTMAVYTHFGGMDGLVEEVVREGLRRFAAHVRARAPETDDALVDLIAGGIAYMEFALANPQLYRLMFGLGDSARVRGFENEAEAGGSHWSMAEGVDAFSVLLGSVERVIEAGTFRPQDATVAATQILTVTHGYVLLLIGGFIGDPETATLEVAIPLNVNALVGLGAEQAEVEKAVETALARAAAQPG